MGPLSIFCLIRPNNMDDSIVNQIFGRVDALETLLILFVDINSWRWSQLCKIVYRKYGRRTDDRAFGWRKIVPKDMFDSADVDEAHIYLSLVNSFYFAGLDPRKRKKIAFDGELLTIHLTWLGLFSHHYDILNRGEPMQMHIDALVNFMSEVYHWDYVPPSESVLFKYF